MNAAELRELAVAELEQKSKDVRGEFFNARVKHATGQLENTAVLNQLRRDVARVETILREKREATQ